MRTAASANGEGGVKRNMLGSAARGKVARDKAGAAWGNGCDALSGGATTAMRDPLFDGRGVTRAANNGGAVRAGLRLGAGTGNLATGISGIGIGLRL